LEIRVYNELGTGLVNLNAGNADPFISFTTKEEREKLLEAKFFTFSA
jgi:hypothetical protein